MNVSRKVLASITDTDLASTILIKKDLEVKLQKDPFTLIETQCESGIFHEVLKTGKPYCANNSYNCSIYNGKVDLETNLPIICYPIKYKGNTIGAFQFANRSGIITLSKTNSTILRSRDEEILKLYSEYLYLAFTNLSKEESLE